MVMTYRNVCDIIVVNDMCVGCGLCAGICPVHVLEMRFNLNKEYIPVEYKEGCLPKCDLCLRACPFYSQDVNEDTLASIAFSDQENINHLPELGYYLESLVGYNNDLEQRLNSASGGLATRLLGVLLENNLVDKIICVMPDSSEPGKLFRFSILDNVDDINKSSKSCYYPVEMSEVIQEISKAESRYAVIGLPCFLKGIRLAMRTNTRLGRRIPFLVGIVCGQTKSTFFAEYLCKLKGGNPALMNFARFRVKDLTKPANHFGFQFRCSDGEVKNATIYWMEGMMQAWSRGYFKLNPCNFCDDVFAEVADVVFMDAWREKYIADPYGTNFVLIRNKHILEIMKYESLIGHISIQNIEPSELIQSQLPVIINKRDHLAQRLYIGNLCKFKAIPHKRVEPRPGTFLDLIDRATEMFLTKISKIAFRFQRKRSGWLIFRISTAPIIFWQRILRRLRYMFFSPS
jgi:coenzyme F420 hydrogenase subunit beta